MFFGLYFSRILTFCLFSTYIDNKAGMRTIYYTLFYVMIYHYCLAIGP